ncbi:MAG: flagellar hook-associated protein FlgL [Gammaproteobacteria bacterium]|nr:flagellar hook-associated protein FlgL [Gammaproteobacteria bacterium]
MRIATMQVFQRGLDSMLDQQSRVFKTQLQLATGNKFTSPADDPTAAAQIMGLNETIAITGQHQENITAAKARLELEDTSLDSAVEVLQRARELAVRGLNDSLGVDGRRAVAQEIRQLMSEAMALANTQDGNGDYLFAGSRVQSAPFSHDGSGTFSYAGDQDQRQLQISPGRQIADSDTGLDVFMKVADPAGGYKDIFTSLYDLATDLEANAPQLSSLGEIDAGMDHLLQVRARVGARLNTIDDQEGINSFLEIQLTSVRSTVQDVDIAETYSRLSQQMLVLQSAQQAFAQVQGLSLFNYLR